MDYIEQNFVSDVYSNIAQHFSSTRYSHWVGVKDYLIRFQQDNIGLEDKINFLDYGCGNGKYLSFGEKFNSFALDNCEELLKIVSKTYPKVNIINADVSANLEQINLKTNFFDSIISIAVIHHLSTESRRIKMLSNIIRMLKIGGTCLITAWATTIKDKSKYIKLDLDGDYLIPWNNEYKRYYHLFGSDELDSLIEKTGLSSNIQIISKKFECDNWFLEIKKINNCS